MPQTVDAIVTHDRPRVAVRPARRVSRRAAVARLELGDVRRSRWLVASTTIYLLLAALFVLVGTRESAVVAFTGMERALFSLSHALVVLLPLLALTGTGLAVNRSRRDGSLELLFGHPVTQDDYLVGVTLVRYGALVAPLLVIMPALALGSQLTFGQSIPWSFLARALLVSASLLWAFVGIGLAISVWVEDVSRAVVYVLVAWLSAVALADFGLVGVMLQWRVPAVVVFVLAGLNPVETARLALLSGADPTLATLGPVGYFLASRLGPLPLLAAGVLWPLAVGSVSWLAARHRFRRSDIV